MRHHLKLNLILASLAFTTLTAAAKPEMPVYVSVGEARFTFGPFHANMTTANERNFRFKRVKSQDAQNYLFQIPETNHFLVVPTEIAQGRVSSGELIYIIGTSEQKIGVTTLSEKDILNIEIISDDEHASFRFTSLGVSWSDFTSQPYFLSLQASQDFRYRIYKYRFSDLTVKVSNDLLTGKSNTGTIEVSNGPMSKIFSINICKNLLRQPKKI